MKSPLRKLKGFGLHWQHDARERKGRNHHQRPGVTNLDELLNAAEELLEMRNCYESLLAGAAATANSVYEFSEALEDMGTCFLAKTALNDDEDCGRALMMLGKAQFKLHKLVDIYRTNIIRTITTPSDSLIKELEIVEDMKRSCDDKREHYKLVSAAHKEKSRMRHAKSDAVSSEQVQSALRDYQEESALFIFRLKSLKQGQFRSLLTQAARHHAAQLSFFRKGLKQLEELDPHVQAVAKQQHIDYEFTGLNDDSDSADSCYCRDEDSEIDELSFNYGIDHPGTVNRKDDMSESPFLFEPAKETKQENSEKFRTGPPNSLKPEPGSKSAPIFANNFDPSEKMNRMRNSSTRKFGSYVLPSPIDGSQGRSRQEKKGVTEESLQHASPLAKQSSRTDPSTGVAMPPRPQGLSGPLANPYAASESMKAQRVSFSGPIGSNKPPVSPGSGGHRNMPTPTSAQQSLSVSPSKSPPHLSHSSTIVISELHELPRPPTNSEPLRPSSLVGYSGPLVPKRQVLASTARMASTTSRTASPLPAPPTTFMRSYSIPSTRTTHNLDVPLNLERNKDLASPPPARATVPVTYVHLT